MPEVDQAYLTQQQELLREIRDELRMSRSTASAMAGGGGGASVGGAPAGQTFSKFQAAADRTMLGEWNTLGWSNAYKHVYESSYSGDLLGAIGLNRAPSSMTQLEYQATARQSLGIRTANLLGNFIAPEYTQFSNELAGTIYKNSQRFIRAGNPMANAFGAGLSYGHSAQLAHSVSQLAMHDSRLSLGDYSQIVDTGMRTNQFNDVGSTDDFIKRTKELAAATASLTRTLHMSVGEITQTMGNLRTMGIQGVSQQQAVIRHIGALSGVAGMSSGEMLSFAGQFAEGQMGSGVNGAAAMQMAATNMALVRNASALGIISPNAIAQAGGASAVAANIARAQIGFASSMPGFLALQGGAGVGGRSSLGAMMNGLSRYRTGGDLLSMNLDRYEALDNMTGDQADNLFRNQISSSLEMVGLDASSRAGQGFAVQMLQNQYGMDAGTARAWAATNLSAQGRRASSQVQVQAYRSERAMQMRDEQDRYFSRHSFAGRVHAGAQALERFTSGILDSAREGIMGYGEEGLDFQMAHLSSYAGAAGTSGMSFSERATALAQRKSRESGQPTELILANHTAENVTGTLAGAGSAALAGGGAAWLGGWGLSALGAASFTGTGAMAAGAMGLGIGLTAAAPILLGAAAVAGVGYLAYTAFGGGDKTRVRDSKQIGQIQRLANANRRANADRGLRRLQELGPDGISGSAWDQLISMSNDATDGDDTIAMAGLMANVVEQNKGITLQDVADMRSARRGVANLSEAFEIDGNKFHASEDVQDAMKTALGQKGWWKDRVYGSNIAASSGSMQKYISSVLDGKGRPGDVEAATLRKMMGDKAFEAFEANVREMYDDDPDQLRKAGKGFGSTANAIADEMLSADEEAAKRFLESRLGDAEGLSREDRNLVQSTLDTLKGGDLYQALDSGRMKELATSGVFGEAAKQAVSVASNEDLLRMSAADFNQKYGFNLSEEEWTKNKKEHGSSGVLRENVMASILGGVGAKQEQAASETEAKLLHKTAQILNEIQTSISSQPAQNGSK